MKRDELPASYDAIAEALERSGGELSAEVLEHLQAFDLRAGTRADPIAAVIRDYEEQEDVWKKEAARVEAQARLARTAIVTLKTFLLERLHDLGVNKLQGVRYVVRAQANPAPSIACHGPIPTEFQRIKVELDTAKARVAWAAGTLPDCITATVGRHIRIEG